MKKGSYTVEAALLMGVLIPLLVGVIYLGFFMMIRGNVQGEAIEKALTALLIGEETEGVSLGEKEVSVEAEAAVPAFPFGKRVFSLADSVQGRFVLERQKPSETIYAQSEKSDAQSEKRMKRNETSYRKEKRQRLYDPGSAGETGGRRVSDPYALGESHLWAPSV